MLLIVGHEPLLLSFAHAFEIANRPFAEVQLVPAGTLVRGRIDLLYHASLQVRELIPRQQEPNRAGFARLPLDQPLIVECDNHLVNRRGRDPEVPLHVAFGRWLSMNLRIVVDEGQVLPLARCVSLSIRILPLETRLLGTERWS